jgi:fructuronate reductase
VRRLNATTLPMLPSAVRRPAYDRDGLAIGMAHIGVGAFHRCHQAEFTDDALETRFGDWGVIGINLRPPRLADSLAAQDHLYTRTLRDRGNAQRRVIGCLRETIDVENEETSEAAVAALASPRIAVVTMTLTEKGYCHVPATGALDDAHPDVRHDLAGPAMPRTALGLLTAALDRRRRAGHGGVTLVSCDNIPSNGAILRASLLGFAAARQGPLVQWIEAHVAFPSTMVDRIVPASTQADIEDAAEALGVRDDAAVYGEPYRQWVLEDRFVGERPAWDLVGVQLVGDVLPYELIKMRVLNAAQSTLSHLGALLGHETSAEAVADPLLATFVRRMLTEETASTLPQADGMAVPAYIDSALGRIANPAIRHRCHQIGTDGSQKIVQRLLNPLRERLATGRSADRLVLAASGWIAYVLAGCRRFGDRWAPSDPWADRIMERGERHDGDLVALARSILSIEAIFGRHLSDEDLAVRVGAHLGGLLSASPRDYLAEQAA